MTDLTAEIMEAPERCDPLLRRAELYRVQGFWELAMADLVHAEGLGAERRDLQLAWARLFLDLARPREALAAANRALRPRSDDSPALQLRAQALEELGASKRAARTYDRLLQRAERASPDIYLRRARLWARAGRLGRALEGLDEGLRRLGNLTSLQSLAAELEIDRGHPEGALRRYAELASWSPRRELWLLRQAEVLESMQRHAESTVVLRQALASLTSRSAAKRSLPLLQQVEADVRARLHGVESGP